jgi:hypothetical protein
VEAFPKPSLCQTTSLRLKACYSLIARLVSSPSSSESHSGGFSYVRCRHTFWAGQGVASSPSLLLLSALRLSTYFVFVGIGILLTQDDRRQRGTTVDGPVSAAPRFSSPFSGELALSARWFCGIADRGRFWTSFVLFLRRFSTFSDRTVIA